MRRAIALVAVSLPLALAACSVDVDGAPCATPGEATDCPAGQACGNDLRCSARAASCAATRCAPASARCGASGATVETCTAADPVCGVWAAAPCAPAGLVCGTRSGAPACECAAYEGAERTVDPVLGSASGALPFPSGALTPAPCRFRSLADGVARAAEVAGPATVQVRSDTPGGELVFGEATGDVPLAIPADVTVLAAPAPAGATVLRAAAATGAPLVALEGRLEGFRIEGGAATGAGVAMTCGATGKPTLEEVAVDGGGALTTGVDVSGGCGAELRGVDVANVAGPALRVRADASAQVTVHGGALRDSAGGVRITGGKVTLGAQGDPLGAVAISGNSGDGLVLSGTATVIDAQLHAAAISANAGTGVVVDVVNPASRLAMVGCDVTANGATAARSYGGATQRQAGGVLLRQAQLASFGFLANRVWANAGDQLAFESSGSWSLSAGACGGGSNVFRCVPAGPYDPASGYVIGVAGSGTVNASHNVWPVTPPDTAVSGAVTTAGWCGTEAGLPAPPQCPQP